MSTSLSSRIARVFSTWPNSTAANSADVCRNGKTKKNTKQKFTIRWFIIIFLELQSSVRQCRQRWTINSGSTKSWHCYSPCRWILIFVSFSIFFRSVLVKWRPWTSNSSDESFFLSANGKVNQNISQIEIQFFIKTSDDISERQRREKTYREFRLEFQDWLEALAIDGHCFWHRDHKHHSIHLIH